MPAQNKIPLTQEGLRKIKEECRKLLKEKRPVIVKRLAESRDLGDLAEDNEYTQAGKTYTNLWSRKGLVSESTVLTYTEDSGAFLSKQIILILCVKLLMWILIKALVLR